MKNTVKISGIIAASVLYCAVVCFVYGFPGSPVPYFPNQQNTDKETCFYKDTATQFCDALPVKISVSTEIGCYETSSSFSYKFSAGVIKSAEQTFSNAFTRYILQSVNFPIRFRKADIIFPFHYFW